MPRSKRDLRPVGRCSMRNENDGTPAKTSKPLYSGSMKSLIGAPLMRVVVSII